MSASLPCRVPCLPRCHIWTGLQPAPFIHYIISMSVGAAAVLKAGDGDERGAMSHTGRGGAAEGHRGSARVARGEVARRDALCDAQAGSSVLPLAATYGYETKLYVA